ncbi:MAG: hypothetical protein HC822_14695 [Oscillochloris sp.]|nr:hypothetical protein [Oscillochloris sp.]
MRRSGSLITAAALLLVCWLIWSRLHIVIWIPLPWWGALIGAIGLFLIVQHLLATLFSRRP